MYSAIEQCTLPDKDMYAVRNLKCIVKIWSELPFTVKNDGCCFLTQPSGGTFTESDKNTLADLDVSVYNQCILCT